MLDASHAFSHDGGKSIDSKSVVRHKFSVPPQEGCALFIYLFSDAQERCAADALEVVLETAGDFALLAALWHSDIDGTTAFEEVTVDFVPNFGWKLHEGYGVLLKMRRRASGVSYRLGGHGWQCD